MAHEHVEYDLNEKYVFPAELRKKLVMGIGIGLVLFIIGAVIFSMKDFNAHHEAAGVAHEGAKHAEKAAEGHHGFNWISRVWANLWVNSLLFTGIAVAGVFFIAVQYMAKAGWSSLILRIPMAFGKFLPITGLVMLVVFLASYFSHTSLFHWTHADLYIKGADTYDSIIDGKAGMFFWPLDKGTFPLFWLIRFFAYFAGWYLLYEKLRANSLAEDTVTDRLAAVNYDKNTVVAATFLVFFGVTSSTSAWDWVMSIDTHWFSTMFGWYMLASWLVTGFSVITLTIILLKEQGYLKMVNENHLHDLGKFMFGLSIFWTYVWFSQFLLIYYANISEETIYFKERLEGFDGVYAPMLPMNLVINFLFPLLFLMTRDAKRKEIFLKVAAFGIIIGHYLDFFVMVMPGTVGEHGGFGLMEIGSIMMFACGFVYVVANTLAKAPLIPKNHPMIEESLAHNI